MGKTFTITDDNNITAYATKKAAKETEKELAEIGERITRDAE